MTLILRTHPILSVRFFSLLLALGLLSLAASAQQDQRDEYYSPPANSKYLKATNGNNSSTYLGNYNWALRFYPARLWYTTRYFGIERSLTPSFSVALDAGWHLTERGMNINIFGAEGSFDYDFWDASAPSTLTYQEIMFYGNPVRTRIPTIGFTGRYFYNEKEGHNVPFLQLQYQFTQSKFQMVDNILLDERFAGGSDTALLQLHTAMLRFGRQWAYGNKIKILNEITIGFGLNMRLSSAYKSVTINPNSSNAYNLNSFREDVAMRRFISPRFQFTYSIGIAY